MALRKERMMNTDWPLVGRAQQLAACQRVFNDVRPVSVVLVGAPGVGKTRLAREALAAAEQAGCASTWVAASRAAASIPFGAVAHLIPQTFEGGIDPIVVLQRAGQWLTESSSGRPIVLAIDDAHCLDQGSAALLYHLVATKVTSVIVTVRLGEVATDLVTALWKDGLANRLDLPPLPRSVGNELAEVMLGGPVDGVTSERLWRLGGGNALYLREVLWAGLGTGALSFTDRVWRWDGAVDVPERLIDLLGIRLGEISTRVRRAVELLAFGEPLDLETLKRARVAISTLEAAEQRGLLLSETGADGVSIRLSHPLIGEALRAQISPLRARELHEILANSAAARPGNILRTAVWFLRAGRGEDAGLMTEGAEAALARFDYSLAERLARCAVAAGGGFAAAKVLAESLVDQGHAQEAEELLGQTVGAASFDSERAALARTRALNMHWGLGRPSVAEEILDVAKNAVDDPACRDELTCLQAKFVQYAGSCPRAVDLAGEVLARPQATLAARSGSFAVLCQSLPGLGKHRQAVAQARETDAADRNCAGELWSMAEAEAEAGRVTGFLWGGQLVEADALARRGYRQCSEMCWSVGTAGWAVLCGEVARARGNLTDSLRWFREAVALVNGDDVRHPYRSFLSHLALGCLARAAAQAGETVEARLALKASENVASPSTAVLDSWFGPIHAWVAVAEGDTTEGIDLAFRSANTERLRGNSGLEIIALHDIVRLGAAGRVLRRLTELAPTVEGALAPLYSSHAHALNRLDGCSLDEVALGFRDLGYCLLAAEAATQAARAHRTAGRYRQANASTAQAAAMIIVCDGAMTPELASRVSIPRLTRRETEIARLAATGLPSRAIASRLTVSVRTVDNTLSSVYSKLGVHRRENLTAALAEESPAKVASGTRKLANLPAT